MRFQSLAWTPERAETVRRRWMAGDSATRIAADLAEPGFQPSRNAVIGLASRRGWPKGGHGSTWKPAEIEIIQANLGKLDDAGLCVALSDAGFYRNLEAVRSKRIRLGLHHGKCANPAPALWIRERRSPHIDRDRAFVRALALGLQDAGLAPRLEAAE